MVLYVDACYEKKHKKYNIQNGIALAAPQVGLTKKIIYVHFNEHKTEHKYLLANPKIISESMQNAYISDGEGCLSVNQKIEGIVKRKNKIIVKAYDINHKKEIKIEANGILAICLQHEIDHLNGILYIDKIDKTNDQSIISQ
jgi:peptide deformylase